MNRAIGCGTVLFVLAALCGLLQLTSIYTPDGRVWYGTLAGVLLAVSVAFFLFGARRDASGGEAAQSPKQQYQSQQPSPAPMQQHYPPQHQQAQPLPPPQSKSGGVLFVPKSMPGDPFRRREPEDDN